MLIKPAALSDLYCIHQLSHKIWWATYSTILPPDQIQFMLGEMYSIDSLARQLEKGVVFLLAQEDDVAVGFAAYSHVDEGETTFKIHKLYVLPEKQGKGIGKQLTDWIATEARLKGAKILELNVNRNNPALSFYTGYGFEIFKEVDIPYYNYFLNDYVMRLTL